MRPRTPEQVDKLDVHESGSAARQAELVYVYRGWLGESVKHGFRDGFRPEHGGTRREWRGLALSVDGVHRLVSTDDGEMSVARTPVPRVSASSTSCIALSPNLLAE